MEAFHLATSCSHYFRETLRGAERLGFNGGDFLQRVGLDAASVHDPAWRGPSEKLAELVQLVWLILDDEFMGFTLQRCKPGVFAMMCNLVIHEETIAAAIRKGVLFYSLFTDEMEMRFSDTGGVYVLEVTFHHPEYDPNNYFLEFWLSIWYRAVCWMAGRTIPLKYVDFNYPKPVGRAEELRYMFPGVQRFSQSRTRLVFGEDLASVPNRRTRAELKAMLDRAPLVFMVVPANVESISRRLHNDILAASAGGASFPQLEHFAGAYGMSAQTLRRRLKQEGTSFRRVIEGIRRDLALRSLLKTRQSVSAIAERLGYSETRAFTRAFIQWTGMTPRNYRKEVLGQFSEGERDQASRHHGTSQP
ncbi:AraC family transcriptional regulator [Camelimonas lactis]|uniref:AraC family transcriptional regulator n=1 Tax=Camelimonas lactis TaxID=659006 RepID=UPI00105355BA|nr:AraC family transcriptional regulator [Camelimonas lactis]